MKIVADRHIPGIAELCSGLGELQLADGRDLNRQQLRDVDVLLVRTVTPVNETLLAGTRVRFVGSATSGTDHIDCDWLAAQGIRFASAPGCNARSVAEYVLSSLFVCALDRGCDPCAWRVGIVGCGHTGRALSGLLAACGIEHLQNDPPLQQTTGDPRYRPLSELHDVDVLSFHVPLTGSGPYATRDLLGRELLAQLNGEVLLINTARGGIVDEPELIEFLSAHRAAAAVLDVWSGEPDFNPDLSARVSIHTPHIAGYSIDGRLQAARTMAAALRDWLGKNPPPPPPQCALPVPDTIDLGALQSEADLLGAAILGGYDVRIDSSAFDAVLALPASRRAAAFLELRSAYRERREFPAHTVRLRSGRESMMGKLRGLGFRLEQA